MKRKLIEYQVFEKIQNESLSSAEGELIKAANILAKTLNCEGLELNCYGPEDVLYESLDGSYVHANYQVRDGYIEFDRVEQLIINEETERAKSKEVISDLIDSLVESNQEKANSLFESWLDLPVTKRIFNEVKKMRVVPIRKSVGGKTKVVGYKKARWETTPKKKESSTKTMKRMKSKVKNNKKMSSSLKKMLSAKRKKIKASIGEWSNLVNNVETYLEYCEFGPVLSESQIKHDENGNVVAVRIPTLNLRNEAKVLQFNWKTLNTDVVVKRSGAKKIAENEQFVQKVTELKRHNALSDDSALEEALEEIASNFSEVLYLTQDELAAQINKALEFAGATNYDDQACEFMAEGILRMAHGAYVDRVAKIVKLAGASIKEDASDKYEEFKSVVETYYKNLDETSKVEMQVFVDLYEALRSVYEMAKEESAEEIVEETASHLDELLAIIKGETQPSLTVAEEASAWLYDIVETNLETNDWNVSDSPHVSATGEHPELAKKAKMGYAPASDFSGEYGDPAPVSDGKSYKGGLADEMRDDAWGNVGGEEVFPSLDNPYVPKPFGDYKIKGEKDVDSDSAQLAHAGGNDAWPALENPYLPKSLVPVRPE
jgi:hypothetical protein